MRRKIFLRFFSVTLLSVLLMFIGGIAAVKTNTDSLMRERLIEETELVCSFVESTDDFKNFAKYENDDDFRVTIIDLNGKVLYESDTDAPLENHSTREEIQNALIGAPSTVNRYSETFGVDMTYYALKDILADGTEIIVRLAIKNSLLSEYLTVTLPILVVVLIFSLILSITVSGILSKNTSDKINEIGLSLKSLNGGVYKPIKTNSSEPELFSVLSEINELNESTHRYIQKISDEHNTSDTILKNVAQGIIALDGSEKIVFANKSALNIFDSANDVTQKKLIFLIDDVELCEKITHYKNESAQIDYNYKNKELSVVIRRIEQQENSAVSQIIIITDVTKEKALQKQKNDFFANASHELKTPVTVMQGLSEIILSKETTDETSRKQIERIHGESLRLASLISDMLKLSKLENYESYEQTLCPVDLNGIANEVVAELKEQIEQKNLTVTISGNAVIKADNSKIFEIFQNLLSNAVHYNKEHGKIDVTVTESANGVTLKVADTGIGIEKENIPRLCERFYRVDKSRSKKTGGTGLGLAIVKHVCALYKANLSIESQIGIGTTVTIFFPKN